MSYGLEYTFGALGSAAPAVSLPNFLCTASLLTGGLRGRKCLDSVVRTAQEQLKHPCVISIVSITNPKHDRILATVKKSNCIPTKSRIGVLKHNWGSSCGIMQRRVTPTILVLTVGERWLQLSDSCQVRIMLGQEKGLWLRKGPEIWASNVHLDIQCHLRHCNILTVHSWSW